MATCNNFHSYGWLCCWRITYFVLIQERPKNIRKFKKTKKGENLRISLLTQIGPSVCNFCRKKDMTKCCFYIGPFQWGNLFFSFFFGGGCSRPPTYNPSYLTTQPSPPPPMEDRKSTLLTSSHITISYARFCLKKKKPNINHHPPTDNKLYSLSRPLYPTTRCNTS